MSSNVTVFLLIPEEELLGLVKLKTGLFELQKMYFSNFGISSAAVRTCLFS
jgi:hypothetical protein